MRRILMSELIRPYIKNKDKDYSKGKLETDFNKEFGTISVKQVFNARKAIREGGDVHLLSENMASQKDKGTDVIRGSEIKEWGLDLDSLLVTEAPYDEKHSVEFYARNIL